MSPASSTGYKMPAHCGAHRRELTLLDFWQADQSRYDLEHYFRNTAKVTCAGGG